MRFWICLLIFLCISTVYSQQDKKAFSGSIYRNTRWSGEIHINGDVTVERGVVLYVEPGTRIFFSPHQDVTRSGNDEELSELTVLGTLVVRGEPAEGRVLFTSEAKKPQIGDWYGIVFKNLNKASILTYAVIEYGYKGITAYGSSPEISFSDIRFNFYAGISSEVRSRPLIRNSIIMGNEVAGINCELASYPRISGSTITQNGIGVIAFDRSNPDLGHWPATGKSSRGLNRIYNNFDYNIYNHSALDIYAQNNVWNSASNFSTRREIYDREDNPVYGKVIFLPKFRKKATRLSSTRPVAPTEGRTGNPARQKKTAFQKNSPDSVTSDSIRFNLPEITTARKEEKPKRLVMRKNIKEEKKSLPRVPVFVREPVLEALLDAGRREYLHREKPEYPSIYRKIGKTGSVIMEIVVGKKGEVKSTRILRSDGDLFSESALAAVGGYKYKPGTFRGKRVSFKIIERFKFELEK